MLNPSAGSSRDPYAGSNEDPVASSSEGGGIGGNAAYSSPYGDLSGISVGQVAPILGGQTARPDYLPGFNMDGRDFFGESFYNMGLCYGSGILVGGAFGAFQGISNSPSKKMKIRMNSVLNGAGRRGSRTGNALAVMALFYTCGKKALQNLEIEKYTSRRVGDFVVPVLAGGIAGALYKATKGPKQMALYSIVGGIAVGGVTVAAGRIQAHRAGF